MDAFLSHDQNQCWSKREEKQNKLMAMTRALENILRNMGLQASQNLLLEDVLRHLFMKPSGSETGLRQ